MTSITLARAQQVLEEGMRRIGARPAKAICLSVCDAQGFLVCFARMDKSPLRSIEIAQRKAYSSVRLGLTTAAFHAKLKKDDLQAAYYGDALLTALPGGAVITGDGGEILGGIGVSGLTPGEDQDLADALAVFAARP